MIPTIHSRDAAHCLVPFSMARRLPTSSREGFGCEPGAIHSIPAHNLLPVARIGGGGRSPTTHAPAVTSFARAGASVAPTVSGYQAGSVLSLSDCLPKLAGNRNPRRFFKFSAVAGSSCPRADEINGTGFVSGPDCSRALTPGADGANRVNAGGIQ